MGIPAAPSADGQPPPGTVQTWPASVAPPVGVPLFSAAPSPFPWDYTFRGLKALRDAGQIVIAANVLFLLADICLLLQMSLLHNGIVNADIGQLSASDRWNAASRVLVAVGGIIALAGIVRAFMALDRLARSPQGFGQAHRRAVRRGLDLTVAACIAGGALFAYRLSSARSIEDLGANATVGDMDAFLHQLYDFVAIEGFLILLVALLSAGAMIYLVAGLLTDYGRKSGGSFIGLSMGAAVLTLVAGLLFPVLVGPISGSGTDPKALLAALLQFANAGMTYYFLVLFVDLLSIAALAAYGRMVASAKVGATRKIEAGLYEPEAPPPMPAPPAAW